MSGKFIEKHGIWSDTQKAAAADVLNKIEKAGLQMVRLSWPDQYGLLRGKMLSVAALKSAFASGSEITMAPFFSIPPAPSYSTLSLPTGASAAPNWPAARTS
nr:hypothetical protein [uncultured bacterium]